MTHAPRPQASGRSLISRLLFGSLLAGGLFGATPALAQAPALSPTPPPEPSFAIEAFLVEGSNLIPLEETAALLAAHTGPAQRFSHIEAARRALQGAYLARGWSLVQVIVPEQEIRDGRVVLRVMEQRIGKVEIIDAAYHDEANIRHSLPGLEEGGVPNNVRLAESLRLANHNPSKQTHLLFRPTPEDTGVDAVIRVEDDAPARVFATLDNTGTDASARLALGFQHANFANRDHVLTAQYITRPDAASDLGVFGIGYRIPFYRWGDSLDLFAGYSNADAGRVAEVFDVVGKGHLAGLRYNLNLRKTSPFEHTLSFGLDHRRYTSDVRFDGEPIGSEITVNPVSLGWVGRREQEGSRISLYATLIANLPIGAADEAAFRQVRAGADRSYSVLRGGASGGWPLGGDWLLNLATDFQASSDALVPGEQFGIGGQDSIRGLDERILTGDSGIRASLEVQSPNFGTLIATQLQAENLRMRALGFVEAGQVSRNHTAPGETSNRSAASIGLGLRAGLGRNFSARLDYGFLLTGKQHVGEDRSRIHAGVTLLF